MQPRSTPVQSGRKAAGRPCVLSATIDPSMLHVVDVVQLTVRSVRIG